ncbi:MAG: prepilin peptidase [Patescibacteria group bacterium]|nr:prepilin peptidase [Patescibacteria group bacterium]
MSISFLLVLSAAVLGAIIGSFLNALSFRFNTGRRILALSGKDGRSRCMSCGHTLEALDLVPIFSFIFLRGRCRWCGSRISWQYPLVEAVAALLSVLVFLSVPGPISYGFWLLVWMTLLFIVIYDLKHTIIPWSCSIFLAALAIIFLLASQVGHPMSIFGIWGLLAGPALAAPLFLLSLVSGGRWMGWGDSALELSLGWLLGFTAGLSALLLAFWSGALIGLGILFYQRLPWHKKVSVTMNMRSEMPFAPFLILGAALALFCHVDFFSQIYLLF